jgi:hypothetical protein
MLEGRNNNFISNEEFRELMNLWRRARRIKYAGVNLTTPADGIAAAQKALDARGKFLREYHRDKITQKQRCREILSELHEGLLEYLERRQAVNLENHSSAFEDVIEREERRIELAAELASFDDDLIKETGAELEAEQPRHTGDPVEMFLTKAKSEGEQFFAVDIGRVAGYKPSGKVVERWRRGKYLAGSAPDRNIRNVLNMPIAEFKVQAISKRPKKVG